MTKVLDILEAFLNYQKYIYLRLDGSTKIDQRQQLVERFNTMCAPSYAHDTRTHARTHARAHARAHVWLYAHLAPRDGGGACGWWSCGASWCTSHRAGKRTSRLGKSQGTYRTAYSLVGDVHTCAVELFFHRH